MKKLPEKITILGYHIKVKAASLEEDHGQYDGDTKTIKIDISPANNWGSTLFHESLHASLDISGVSEVLGSRTEEAVVRCIENALWPLIEKGVFNAK